MTLPRRLTLIGKDQLGIEPAGDIESLRGEHAHVDAMTLPANEEIVLEGVRGNAMELVAEIDPKGAPMVELNVLRSAGRGRGDANRVPPRARISRPHTGEGRCRA